MEMVRWHIQILLRLTLSVSHLIYKRIRFCINFYSKHIYFKNIVPEKSNNNAIKYDYAEYENILPLNKH